MSNAIAIQSLNALCFERRGKPTKTNAEGRISRRSLIGVMTSGTVEERFQAAMAICRFDWENAQYDVLLAELGRVFTATKADKSLFDNLLAFCKLDRDALTRKPMLDVMENLVRIHAASKGEKAKYVRLMSDLIDWSNGEAERKAARKAAYEASLLAANAVETC